MIRLALSKVFPALKSLSRPHIARNSKNFLKAFTIASVPLCLPFAPSIFCSSQPQQKIETPKASIANEIKATTWQKFKNFLAHFIRLIHLSFIFLPSILTLPLRYFRATEKIWLKLFVWSVEKAGVVWIKVFQYLSHRRDIIGAEMAESFIHLRENAPQHSFEMTKEYFRQASGKSIEQIFEYFDTKPIASGSVSQVYRATYKGKKVAVKVRHPEVEKYIQRDVNLMFAISKFFSFFSKQFEIPIGEQSLKRTLIEQMDFTIEKDNLNVFNQQFMGNQQVRFPTAFEGQTSDSILVESFAEGLPITHFQNNPHPLNAVIARLGASTFFEMLMKNNFIHADCHGGNILVEITKQSATFFSQIKDYVSQKIKKFECLLTEQFMENEILRKLYRASREEEERIMKMVRECKEKVKITLIDVGMVIKLEETDRLNFINFIKSVIQGNSDKCATMIYNLSNFEGQKIISGKFQNYKTQLQKLFSVLDNKSIFDIEGIELLVGMLDIIRQNNMKLDGEFATLLTNMVVLESIAKEIDPNIQILKCAVPYFRFVDDLNREKDIAMKII